MNSTDSLTISLWYLSPIPTNISSTHFELWESNNLSNQIHLNFSFNPIPTGYMYTFIPGIGQANDSMGTRTYNAWHHIVVVKAGITETVYVDNIPNFGQFTGTNSTLNFDKFELGREFTTGGNLTDTYYIGKLDDIGIWNRALTQQEITDLYNGNSGITGFNSVTHNNIIKIFPNPANDYITIDYGNFAIMNGYQLKIENSLGQQLFQTNITQQTDYLSLNNWGGNGLYFVHIIDAQGNTIDIRKIVLQ